MAALKRSRISFDAGRGDRHPDWRQRRWESSTLRAISGLVKPKSGKILFKGEDITGKNPTEIVSKGITLVPEGLRIFADLTVKENLRVGGLPPKDDISEDMEWVFNLFPRLREREWQALRHFIRR